MAKRKNLKILEILLLVRKYLDLLDSFVNVDEIVRTARTRETLVNSIALELGGMEPKTPTKKRD